MVKDYRTEIGLPPAKKPVPKAVAIIVLVLVAAVIGVSAMQIVEAGKKRHHGKAAATAPAS
jgi:hypothetical protein